MSRIVFKTHASKNSFHLTYRMHLKNFKRRHARSRDILDNFPHAFVKWSVSILPPFITATDVQTVAKILFLYETGYNYNYYGLSRLFCTLLSTLFGRNSYKWLSRSFDEARDFNVLISFLLFLDATGWSKLSLRPGLTRSDTQPRSLINSINALPWKYKMFC